MEDIQYSNVTHTLGDGIQIRYEIESNKNTGWVCPTCGKSVSPNHSTCPYCSTQSTDEGLNPGEKLICG